MYGRWEGELWFHRWHMWPVPSSSTPSVAAPSNSFVLIDTNSFSKDGRTIHVGDCALFLPSQNSLPFVGIIRKLKKVGKDNKNNLTLSVNWLYRPADIKLKEGASFEAAPNEVFYSFHKDEIPAASLLHPCKVSFLPKGSQLPSGLSSFVCRRVYDIQTQRLWWLTDQNYLNKRQQEVNKLLDKTRVEMYGAVQTQTGARSPKPLTGQQQVKPTSDNVQNSSSSISSHAKSKKRDHNGHKSKVDDADSGQQKSDHFIRTEINKITEKGGITDSQGVDKLIQLMKPENSQNTEKKLDLLTRTLLVDVISVTESFDCLTRFVQVKGLSILDEWLQEIHKGKIGNLSPKETDKSIEEFLFSLLRALDRLPVNLHALQTCNVGKSVNHLRSHKNQEIQKKARSLVSTWKRRVEAEMTMIETKSSTSRGGGSWPNRRSNSTSQPSPLKNSGDPAAKSPPSKVAVTGGGSSDIKECSSNQSPNSQSCSSDHGKTGGTSSLSKISSGVYNSRNSSNGFHGVGGQKGNLGKSQNEKELSSPRHVSEMSIVDNGNNNQNNVPEPSEKVSGKVDGKDGREEVKSVTVTVVLPCDENNGSSSVTPKQGNNNKLYEASYSSINALVESCAKFSEASVSPSDDGGMNLLASVAAGEMSRGDVDPTCSPPLPEDSCSANVNKLKREDNVNVANGPEGDSKDVSASESVIPIPIPRSDVKMEDLKVETQINEESASWSSSDINDEEKKKVNDRSRLLEESQGATTSCGDAEMKCEEKKETSDSHEAERNRDSRVKSETETVVKLDFDLNEDIPIDEEAANQPLPSSNSNGNRSPLVTVPAKGPFYPSENLSRTKSELGWKGSAATSAFRPAVKPARPLLDFDLNVGVDDSAQNDNSGIGIDLDLNAIEPPEPLQFPLRAIPSNSSRGFDLNGPGVEEVESVQFPKKGMQFVPNVRGVNLSSSWFPPNNTFTIPSIPSMEQQQQSYNTRMLSPVLSSTPAVVPFQYSPFPFETNFPLPNTFMDVPAGVFPAQGHMVSMPYFMSLPGGSSNVGKWGSPGGSLDLNAGPTEEQIKMFQQLAPGGKRKEPDSGWDYKQQHPSWQ